VKNCIVEVGQRETQQAKYGVVEREMRMKRSGMGWRVCGQRDWGPFMGEGKRSEVFTTFGGRSTVLESSFSGTILEMIQMPFLKNIYIYIGAKRGECGYFAGSWY